jgi:hypothetical protein
LIFSDLCNDSEYIRREVTVAGESQKIIIPFRIEDAKPRKGLRVRLSDLHWIDAFVSREKAINELMQSCGSDIVVSPPRTENDVNEIAISVEAGSTLDSAAAPPEESKAHDGHTETAEAHDAPTPSNARADLKTLIIPNVVADAGKRTAYNVESIRPSIDPATKLGRGVWMPLAGIVAALLIGLIFIGHRQVERPKNSDPPSFEEPMQAKEAADIEQKNESERKKMDQDLKDKIRQIQKEIGQK